MYERLTTLPFTYRLTWTGQLDPERECSAAATAYGELISWTDTVFTATPYDIKSDFVIVGA